MEGDNVLNDGGAGDARGGGIVDKGAIGVGWIPSETDEDSESEERIHIDDAVEGGDVDAGGHRDLR